VIAVDWCCVAEVIIITPTTTTCQLILHTSLNLTITSFSNHRHLDHLPQPGQTKEFSISSHRALLSTSTTAVIDHDCFLLTCHPMTDDLHPPPLRTTTLDRILGCESFTLRTGAMSTYTSVYRQIRERGLRLFSINNTITTYVVGCYNDTACKIEHGVSLGVNWHIRGRNKTFAVVVAFLFSPFSMPEIHVSMSGAERRWCLYHVGVCNEEKNFNRRSIHFLHTNSQLLIIPIRAHTIIR